MQLDEVMRTTFAAREFTDQPVGDDVLYRIIDLARFAPSGGNRQGWSVIIVRDPETKAALARVAEPAAKRYAAQRAAGEGPWNPLAPPGVSDEEIERTPPPPVLTQPYIDAPVVLIVCVDLRVVAAVDQHLDRIGVISGASVYPFAWNILLAARAEGLGGTLTTLPISAEPELKRLLAVPEHVALCAVIPLGHPARRLTRLRRLPVEEITHRERWDGGPLMPGTAPEEVPPRAEAPREPAH